MALVLFDLRDRGCLDTSLCLINLCLNIAVHFKILSSTVARSKEREWLYVGFYFYTDSCDSGSKSKSPLHPPREPGFRGIKLGQEKVPQSR